MTNFPPTRKSQRIDGQEVVSQRAESSTNETVLSDGIKLPSGVDLPDANRAILSDRRDAFVVVRK